MVKKKILRFFKEIFATETLRHSTVAFSFTILNGFLGAIFYVLSARFLGPDSFGLMVVAISVLTLIGDIADLGLDTGIVRFVGKFAKTNKEKAYKYLKLSLKLKLASSLVVLVLGLTFSSFIAVRIFSKASLTLPLKLAFAGVSSYLLFRFITSCLQAFQRFWLWGIIQVATNALRLIVLTILFFLNLLTLKTNLINYIFIPFIGFLIGLFFLPKGFTRVKNEKGVFSDLFHFNKWVTLFHLLAATGARLDTFLSARLLSLGDVGVYSSANQLVSIVPQIVAGLSTVIAPKIAGLRSLKDFKGYLKKTQIFIFFIALLGILAMPLVIWLIPIVYGEKYIASVKIFIVLFFAMLVFLISVPIHLSVFYYFSYPKLFVILSFFHLFIIGFVGWNMILSYKAMGAAVTVLIGQIFNFVVPFFWVLGKIRNKN